MECIGLILRLVIVLILMLTLSILTAVLYIVWDMPDLPKVYATDLCLRFAQNGETYGELTCGDDSLHRFAQERIRLYYGRTLDDYINNRGENKDIITLKSYLRDSNTDLKPVARLTGDYNKEAEKEQKGDTNEEKKSSIDHHKLVPVHKWTSLRKMASTGGIRRFGVQIKNGRIIVPVAGEYAVYSLIHFREPCLEGIPQVEDPNIPIKQSIFKFDILDGRDVEVASSCQPHKISQNYDINMYASFISLVVRLKAGDELSIKVSNITYLTVPSFNYFGAHLISDP